VGVLNVFSEEMHSFFSAYIPQFLAYGVGGPCIVLVLVSAKLGSSEYALGVRLRYQQDAVFREKRVVFDDRSQSAGVQGPGVLFCTRVAKEAHPIGPECGNQAPGWRLMPYRL
jgi:hypothetical protein